MAIEYTVYDLSFLVDTADLLKTKSDRCCHCIHGQNDAASIGTCVVIIFLQNIKYY
jgi:hypothetical protein